MDTVSPIPYFPSLLPALSYTLTPRSLTPLTPHLHLLLLN